MLPEGLGCALHDKETAVLELDRDRRAVTFAFVAKGKFPFSAKAERANRGILPERLFVVAVPAHAFAAVVVQIAETGIEQASNFLLDAALEGSQFLRPGKRDLGRS